MPELADYSGAYRADIKYEDFSKDFLIKLMNIWRWAYMRVPGFWFEEVSERFGAEAAESINDVVWTKIGEKVVPKFARVANIELNTVLDSLKLMDMCPDSKVGSDWFDGTVDIINENHVRATTTYCRLLESYERSAPERIPHVCGEMEKKTMERYFNNPRIKITSLKLPPRKSADEICCQWEFKIEE